MGRLESGARLGLVAWAMAVTMARAVRCPNDFAEAHWLVDYRFGFIRRGLAGSLYALPAEAGLVPQSAAAIAVLSFAIFGALLLLLLAASRRILEADANPALSFSAAAVFATSPYVVMAGHFMGYLDHLVVLVAFAAAWLAARGRARPAAALAAVGVLLHESFLLVGLPLVVAAAALAPLTSMTWRARVLPLALPVGAALALFLSEALVLNPSVLRQQLTARLAAFPFVAGDMHVFVPEWLTLGSWENLRGQSHAIWRRLGDPNLLRLMAPSALYLAVYAARSTRGSRRPSPAALVAFATAAPLLLHLVAWDTARIWAFTIVAAFACAWLVASAAGGDRDVGRTARPRTARLLVAVSALIVVANLLGRSPLMDGEVERFSTPLRLFLYSPFIAGAALAIADGLCERRP
ncbi:MAG TPA: hypothetical protein PLN93_10225 [Vicinamibacterales bacterium]|nr:hypothetical protein [Vicinamibacterales bacterium]HOQ61567.1 hypothetical protein [Vicinamibacterales bacterium]HPK72306.1 hypothetical protein [Vicinamibacterales bacterium]